MSVVGISSSSSYQIGGLQNQQNNYQSLPSGSEGRGSSFRRNKLSAIRYRGFLVASGTLLVVPWDCIQKLLRPSLTGGRFSFLSVHHLLQRDFPLMRARWVNHNPHIQLPEGLQTTVAMWWPGRYYWVSTIRCSYDLATALLPSFDSAHKTQYLTEIIRCDKTGWIKRMDVIYYQKGHKTLEEAKAEHERTVNRLAAGKLTFEHRLQHR